MTPYPRGVERVRRAVAALLAAFDAATRNDAARRGGGAVCVEVDAAELYDAALTVVMRLVYLPVAARHDMLVGSAGVASAALAALRRQLGARAAVSGRAALARRHDAWRRLLAILRGVHVTRERSREGAAPLTCLHLLHITNNIVLDLLDGVLDLECETAHGEGPERGDYGAIEWVGMLYQQLRDDSAVRATEPLLGVAACGGRAPFLPLGQLEEARAAGDAALLAYLHRATRRAIAAIAADLAASGVTRRGVPAPHDDLRAVCGGDADLYHRARPFARLLRTDVAGRPVVVPGGHVYIKCGRGRRANGLHYTPPPVAATVVRHALDQVAYEGAACELPRAEWRLRPAAELLELKICDMAMGCGAFLVESCRYLAARLTDAWALAEQARPGAPIDAAGRPVDVDQDQDQDQDARTIPREPAARLALARRLVAGRCLYGVDQDPIAVELTRLALLVESRTSKGESAAEARPGQVEMDDDTLSILDERLRVGDALIGAPIDVRRATCDVQRATCDVRRSFDWPRAFPEVFARGRDRAGFDAIVGNPPFGNGIERATARATAFKRYAAAHYAPFAHGAGDYCLIFWGRALLHLLAPGGAYGWLGPTALLSDLKPWQAWVHEHARPTTLILYPVDLFPGARIRTTAYCGRRGQSSRVTVVDYDTFPANSPRPITLPWPSTLACWYEVTRRLDAAPRAPSYPEQRAAAAAVARPDMASLADLPVRLHAGCATAAAYELAPLVADDVDGHGARLVTTGALDRYACAWGQAPIRYLQRTYHHPRWPAHPVAPAAVARALERQRGPKILVGGLTAVLECWLDERGDAAGVVSTWVVAPGEGVMLDGLYLLLAVLNSATFSRLYMERYGARSMSGRQTTIYKQALCAMPCPRVVGPAMLSPMWEWRGPLRLDSTDGLLAVCRYAGRALQEISVDHQRRHALDRLGHLAVGLLYGRGEDGAKNDYAWWCERTGVAPDDPSPPDLVDALGAD